MAEGLLMGVSPGIGCLAVVSGFGASVGCALTLGLFLISRRGRMTPSLEASAIRLSLATITLAAAGAGALVGGVVGSLLGLIGGGPLLAAGMRDIFSCRVPAQEKATAP